jgi:hypothetical protein
MRAALAPTRLANDACASELRQIGNDAAASELRQIGNDAAASTAAQSANLQGVPAAQSANLQGVPAAQSGKSQGEAPPPRFHTTPAPTRQCTSQAASPKNLPL